MRHAIYFTPAPDDPLTEIASRWLGRDAFGGDVEPLPPVKSLTEDEQAALTAAPRRYGFHATLKAPFRLAAGRSQTELEAMLGDIASTLAPVQIELDLRQIDGFFALVPKEGGAALQALAGRVVEAFDVFRAPLDEADIERRRPQHFDATERVNFERWGYPYVFDRFRFHMTLTERVPPAESGRIRDCLVGIFGRFVGQPILVDRLALFVEVEPGAPFTVASVAELSGVS